MAAAQTQRAAVTCGPSCPDVVRDSVMLKMSVLDQDEAQVPLGAKVEAGADEYGTKLLIEMIPGRGGLCLRK